MLEDLDSAMQPNLKEGCNCLQVTEQPGIESVDLCCYPFAQSALRTCTIWRSLPHNQENHKKFSTVSPGPKTLPRH